MENFDFASLAVTIGTLLAGVAIGFAAKAYHSFRNKAVNDGVDNWKDAVIAQSDKLVDELNKGTDEPKV